MGWDTRYGYQLYQSDPSGNYSGWKATCIGNSSAVGFTLFFSVPLVVHDLGFVSVRCRMSCGMRLEYGMGLCEVSLILHWNLIVCFHMFCIEIVLVSLTQWCWVITLSTVVFLCEFCLHIGASISV